MEYKRGAAGKEVGTTPEPMDQQTADPFLHHDGEPTPPVVRLATPWILAYTALIVVGALVLCCIVAGLAVLGLAATQGRDGLADFSSQYQFDFVLQAHVGAAGLSALYMSVAAATLLAARLIARERWLGLVAWRPIKPGRGRTLMLSVGTLVYAAAMTFTIETMQDHRLLMSGPTDVILLGMLMTNLCILAPIAEELFFRGWLYTALRGELAFWPSYIVTTTLFAAIHWYASVTHMLKVLPLAVVLGLVREWKGSIKPTIAVHAIYNLTIVLITLAET